MELICPRCGSYTAPRSRFCKGCGGSLKTLRETLGDGLRLAPRTDRPARTAASTPRAPPPPPPAPAPAVVAAPASAARAARPPPPPPPPPTAAASPAKEDTLFGLDFSGPGGPALSADLPPFSFDASSDPQAQSVSLFDTSSSRGTKVDFSTLVGSMEGEPGASGSSLFDLNALGGSAPSTPPAAAPAREAPRTSSPPAAAQASARAPAGSAPEPEIDFSLLSNPDKNKIVKGLEELDFSKSNLSESGASRLLDGDLDFTGLSSPGSLKGYDNVYSMDELPSLVGPGGPKPPTAEDPFATLLNQPARPRQAKPSVVDSKVAAQVESELDQAVARPAGGPLPTKLSMMQGNRVVQAYPFKRPETVIGVRDDMMGVVPDVDLTNYDAAGLIAARHCIVGETNGNLYVLDCKGSTGTQLNGKNLEKEVKVPAKAGDLVALAGQITLRLDP